MGKRIELKAKFKGYADDTAWLEVLEVPGDKDPETYGAWIVEWFNETRTAREKEREYVASRILPEVIEHDWEKQNLYTVMGRGGVSYDVMKCRGCGATGRRYGIGGHVERDKAFKAKKYDQCKEGGRR